ncbi:MAG: NAD-dependent epimerase/dehydratase family protein [Blautia sp.]|nr:NAD-dependent epimerase/dehydratase family protein [Blautia sp.]
MKLIIGAGFIGSALAARFAGKEKIRVVSRSGSPLFSKHNIEYVKGNLKELEWDTVLKDVDMVYVMTGTIISYDGTHGIINDMNEAVIPMLNLIRECRDRGIRRIIYPSSGGTVYGKYSVLSRESDPTLPHSVYAAHKVVLENYFRLFNIYDGMEIFSLRITNPYGYMVTTDRKQGIIPIFIDRIVKNMPIEVWGSGNNTRDYVYIDDVINALDIIAEYSGDVRCFNIGTSVAASINDIIRIIEKYTGKKANVSYRPGRICDAESSSLNIDLAKQELGWEPYVSLEQGIQRLAGGYGFLSVTE